MADQSLPPAATCSVDGCDDIVKANGLCGLHLHRFYRHGDPTVVRRSTPGPRRPSPPPSWLDLDELLAVDPDDQTWRQQGICTPADLAVLYPARLSEAQRAYDRAREICQECPVRLPCLAAGMSERHGCWGGCSPRDRTSVRRALEQRKDRSAA